MTEVASAYVSLIPSAKGFATGIQRQTGGAADAAGRDAGKRFGGRFASSLKGVIGGALIATGVTSLIRDSLGEAREAQKVTALTNQVIKTTGGVANVTAAEVGALANAISKKVGVDDEAIQSGENLLLTFKNVRNEVGKGNAIFDRATRAAVNLSAAGFGELTGTSKQLGKALNDPVKGITALSRAGVTFTQAQKDQIKALVDSGKVLQAQKVILKEVESQVGGAAKAQATAGDKARVSWKNLEEQIGTALLPVVDDLANKVADDVVPAISEFITEMQDGTGAGGELVDVLKDTVGIGKAVLGFFNGLPGPVKKYGVQLAIAAVVLSKVNSGLTAGRSAISGWVSSLGPAEAKMARVSKASYALGAGLRNLAGAGGMIALADGAQRSNHALGTLETTLGGAAAGFAVGGPIGAAVGGLAGGLFGLYQATKKSTDEAKVSLPSWKEYASTLGGVSAATTKATRDMAFQRLEQSGLLTATRELGLTDRQAVSAMLGNTAARQRLSAALRNQNVLTAEQEAALRKETGAVGASREAQLRHNVAIAKSGEELQKARKALRDFMGEPASKRVSITGVEDAKGQLASLTLAIRQAWGAAKDLNSATPGGIDALLSPTHRAMGGPVRAGQPYIVGETQPELFVPRVNGTIIPQVSSLSTTSSSGSSVDQEQSAYRAFTRALADTRTVIMSKDNLDDLDLLVGAV